MPHASAGETVRACERLVLDKAPLLIATGGGASEGIGMEPMSPAERAEIVRLRTVERLKIREIADCMRRSNASIGNVLREAGLHGYIDTKHPRKKAA